MDICGNIKWSHALPVLVQVGTFPNQNHLFSQTPAVDPCANAAFTFTTAVYMGCIKRVDTRFPSE
jgi:hypothetical protein